MPTLKKLFYGFLTFFVVLIVAVVFAANSSYVIKKAADQFAPDYKISYDDITGNILTGVTINGLKFESKPITKSVRFSWDPSRLLYKRIAVNEINIDALDVDVVKSLIASFPSDDNNSEPFDFVVTVDKVHVSVNLFEEQGILISKTVLDVKGVKYATDALNIKAFALLIDSNVSQIDIKGDLTKDTLSFEHVILKDIDTLALQKLFGSDSNESASNESETAASEAQNSIKHKEVNHLVPKTIVIKSLHSNVLPIIYDPVHIINLVLNGKNIRFDTQKLLVENGSIDLNGTTNLSNFKHRGKLKNNHLCGEVVLMPNKKLFELYELPLRKEAIGDIAIDFNASKEKVVADIKSQARNILISKKGEFNIDIDSLFSHVVYAIKENSLVADSKVIMTTPYAEDISITNNFIMDDNISYTGEIKAKELIGIDAKFTKALKNLNIKYTGDAKSIKTLISSDGLKGSFDSSDFKKGILHLETKEPITVSELVELPTELNGTKVNAVIDVPLDFAAITPLKAKVKITSNITNLDADIMYGKTLQVKAASTMPEDSLLKLFDKNIKWNAINPLVLNVELSDKDAVIKLKSKELSTDIKYFLDDGKVDGKIKLGGLITDVKGIAQKKITINSKVDSMKSLLDSVRSFYTLEALPQVEGALNLSMDVTEMKQVDITLTSPKIIYQSDRKTEHIINDVKVVLNADKSQLVLKSYQVTYDKMKFFATKPSTIAFKDTTVTISPLWLNDELKVVGEYNLKTKQGKVDAQADKLHFTHEIIDLDSNIDIKTVLDANKTSVKGEVTLLGGDIKYDMSQKSFASDSDIIIVQDMKDDKASPFMDGLSIAVQIKTKKPLVYKKDAVNIKAKIDLGVHKAEYSDLMVLGSVEILKGGSYTFEGKKFVIDKSYIHFTGDPNKPLLEISVDYKSLNHLITITVSGTPETPNINFSSKPSLSREEILSVILFDSEAGAGTHSSEDMMKMMGGAMAKSALSNIGVKLDHLVLGEGNSVEVGKKLTNKITIIYVNDEVSSVKLKYQHGKRTESVMGASEESQSYDIIYKRDF